jgi:hypothetical protein
VVSGVGAAIVAVALSGCGTSPSLPPVPVVSSPFHGWSTVVVDPLTQIARQGATVRVCSPGGGPLAVDVQSPDADADTDLAVRVVSTDWETTGDVPGATLIDAGFHQPIAPVDAHVESNRPLRPGECADVGINSTRNLFQAGPPFTYTVTW